MKISIKTYVTTLAKQNLIFIIANMTIVLTIVVIFLLC